MTLGATYAERNRLRSCARLSRLGREWADALARARRSHWSASRIGSSGASSAPLRRHRLRPRGRSCPPLSDEFDEVGAEIDRALDHFNVPQPERQEFLAAIVARKDEVVKPSP